MCVGDQARLKSEHKQALKGGVGGDGDRLTPVQRHAPPFLKCCKYKEIIHHLSTAIH